MKKIILCLIFFTTWCFSAKQAVIVAIKSKDIAPYNTALEGFKEVVKERSILVTFKEYNLEETNVIEKVRNEKPDLILTIGTSATKLVSEKIKDIPIIFSMIIDPEGVGLKSKNLTGSPLDIPIRLQFENLRTIIPKVRRIGVIYNPKENESIIQKAIETASDMGFVLKTYQVESTEDIQKIPKMEEMNIDVLWLVTDTIVCQLAIIKQILYSCLKNKIPVMGISSSYVKAGALLALSCDYEDIGRQSGEIAEKILNGKDLSTIQVSVPRKTKLYLNISVADRLGIKIPKEIIEKAEEVFGK